VKEVFSPAPGCGTGYCKVVSLVVVHTLFAQRNEFGEAFRKNGYVLPGDKPKQSEPAAVLTEGERKLDEALLLTGHPSNGTGTFMTTETRH
jgi:hypothetical protein